MRKRETTESIVKEATTVVKPASHPRKTEALPSHSSVPAPLRERPEGKLSDTELARLRAAYAAGATGALLIGLRQRRRILTVMLPAQPSERLAVAQMERAGRQLRTLRCDGCVYARRARLRIQSVRHPALIVDTLERGTRDRVVLLLDGSEVRWELREHFLDDAVTRALFNPIAE